MDYQSKTPFITKHSGCKCIQQLHPSNWRISLLSNDDLDAISSGEACSYCFSNFTRSEWNATFNCCQCFRRVHVRCIPNHPLLVSSSDWDSFVCVDCGPYARPLCISCSTEPLEVSVTSFVADEGEKTEDSTVFDVSEVDNLLNLVDEGKDGENMNAMDSVAEISKSGSGKFDNSCSGNTTFGSVSVAGGSASVAGLRDRNCPEPRKTFGSVSVAGGSASVAGLTDRNCPEPCRTFKTFYDQCEFFYHNK